MEYLGRSDIGLLDSHPSSEEADCKKVWIFLLNINQFGFPAFDPKSESAGTHKGENAQKITFHASKKLKIKLKIKEVEN